MAISADYSDFKYLFTNREFVHLQQVPGFIDSLMVINRLYCEFQSLNFDKSGFWI
jgi:hypothetical protein